MSKRPSSSAERIHLIGATCRQLTEQKPFRLCLLWASEKSKNSIISNRESGQPESGPAQGPHKLRAVPPKAAQGRPLCPHRGPHKAQETTLEINNSNSFIFATHPRTWFPSWTCIGCIIAGMGKERSAVCRHGAHAIRVDRGMCSLMRVERRQYDRNGVCMTAARLSLTSPALFRKISQQLGCKQMLSQVCAHTIATCLGIHCELDMPPALMAHLPDARCGIHQISR